MARLVEFNLNSENPSPFKQPFLVLGFEDAPSDQWFIDVDGKIDLYIARYSRIYEVYGKKVKELGYKGAENLGLPQTLHEIVNWRSQATPLLEDMLAKMALHKRLANYVNAYTGSAGPSHILRNGALFRRMSLATEEPKEKSQHMYPDIEQYLPILGVSSSNL